MLAKSGLHVTICEMPRAGDGTLVAALAAQGVSLVHALAPDNRAAETARIPALAAGVMGSQVIVETGKADALPLGDSVADLYLVTDATDANLNALTAAEAARVLAPYRGVAIVQGYLDVPTTGIYHFSVKGSGGSFTLYDRTGQ